jgi:hypothetical protein
MRCGPDAGTAARVRSIRLRDIIKAQAKSDWRTAMQANSLITKTLSMPAFIFAESLLVATCAYAIMGSACGNGCDTGCVLSKEWYDDQFTQYYWINEDFPVMWNALERDNCSPSPVGGTAQNLKPIHYQWSDTGTVDCPNYKHGSNLSITAHNTDPDGNDHTGLRKYTECPGT